MATQRQEKNYCTTYIHKFQNGGRLKSFVANYTMFSDKTQIYRRTICLACHREFMDTLFIKIRLENNQSMVVFLAQTALNFCLSVYNATMKHGQLCNLT